MAPTVTRIDFSNTALNHYAGFYAAILDDVFTQEECRALVSLAVSSESWKPATLPAGGDIPTVHTEFRNSERILFFDEDAAHRIYLRLRPLVEAELGEITVGEDWDGITGKKGRKQGPTWKLAGVNPRLSFLRYGPGHYFNPHCDGLNTLPQEDGSSLKSFVTLHLYLNGTGDQELEGAGAESSRMIPKDANLKLFDEDPDAPLLGGATRFWTPDRKHYLDVFPLTGRVLVFQQRMLVHSGEKVVNGVKYTMRSDFMFSETN
ncbi:hypothetical protein HYPSUDRAFT_72557 [Hypholoma sublateritium FD-334 SS-4]|uniref:Prolyl 4-hydroxylase alpha subunit domain-containing protein n=1 Tax=Hypholoma sublateritium (strain FD-334 SS-4) TaxID=945553 RepID=A0A0D2KIL0_HYPSF|nr:hypothetical protein HYPSUDRAFT_72557 [Hypholoma sublateritium FD-334 SS-4]